MRIVYSFRIEIAIGLISFFVFVGSRLVYAKLSRKFKNLLIKTIFEVFSGLIFLAYCYFIFYLWPKSIVVPFLWNFAILYLGFSCVNSVFTLLPGDNTAMRKVAKFLFLLSFVVSLLIAYKLYPSYWFSSPDLRKWFVLLGGLVLVVALLRAIRSPVFSYLIGLGYIVFSILWALGKIWFSFLSLSMFFCLVFLVLGYFWFITELADKLHKFSLKLLSPEDVREVIRGYKYFISAVFLYCLEVLITLFTGQDLVHTYLSSFYLIKGTVIKISGYRFYRSVVLGFAIWGGLKVLKKLVKAYFPEDRRDFEGASAETIVFNFGVLFVVVVMMASLGITWKIVLPVAGTLGIGIGFGLQTIMNNYMSGFILLFSQKVRVGDIVEVTVSTPTLGQKNPTVFGKVEEIGILATTIRTTDGVDIAIPNSNFINSPIINYSHRDSFVRLRLPVGVAYSSDPEMVRDIILNCIREIPGILKHPEPSVWFYEYGASALIFVATFWFDVRKYIKINKLRDRFYTIVWYKLKEAGIEIPFNQTDVWFRNKLELKIDKGGAI